MKYFRQRQELLRLVLDTSVIVAAFRSRDGASRRLIDLVDLGHYKALLSPALLLEYEAVLTRPEQMRSHAHSSEHIHEFLDGLATRAAHVTTYFQWRPQLTDPGDEFVLEAAINGRADAIVTFNTAHFSIGAARFGIRVLTPRSIIGQESIA